MTGLGRLLGGPTAPPKQSTSVRADANPVNKKSNHGEVDNKLAGKETSARNDTNLNDLRQTLRKLNDELQEVRWTNAQLINSNESLHVQMRRLEKENEELSSSNSSLEVEAQWLRSQYHESVQSNEIKRSQIQKLKELKTATEKDLINLQETHAIQHKELQICRDDLFNLQPMVQLTDSQILSQYETLCQQISNWVDNEISIYEDNFHNARSQPPVIVHGNDLKIKAFLQKAPEGGEYLLVAMIHRFIQKGFFEANDILFGFPEVEAAWIDEAANMMPKLEPKRGTFTINVPPYVLLSNSE